MSGTKPDRILNLLVGWMTYLLVFSWLPLVRVLMDGESYQWGTNHFGIVFRAAGWEPDAWLLVFKSALLILLIFVAHRRNNVLFRVLLVIWSLVLAADAVYGFWADPSGFEFHGDTLGIHLNLGWPVVAIFCGFALLALYWVAKNPAPRPQPSPPAWAPRSRRLLVLLLVLLPVQFLLLRFGEPHGTSDAIGVLLTIAQCPLLAFALYPWPVAGRGE